jgi:hypothetical protein
MIESLKNVLWGGLGIGFYLFLIGVFIVGVIGLVLFTEHFADWLGTLNSITLMALVLLSLSSFVPSARAFTGNGIVFCSYIFGVLLWLFALVVTYEFWGVIGVFIGAVLLGIGIFATGFFALLFNGEFSSALIILGSLVLTYGVRVLGHWILSKYRPRITSHEVLSERETKSQI